MQDAVQDRDLLNYVELFVPKDFASCAVCGRPAAMSEVSYVLPPTDEMYDVLLQGLKRFSEDLQTGATDSSALGYGWSPAPFAAKISAPRLLRPKPPSLSLSLRDAEVRPPAPASARTAMPSTPERPRRPSSAGRRNDEPLPRISGRGPNGAQTASELKLKAQGQLTLPPPKSSRQRSQKNLHMAKPFKTNALMQPPVQPGTETTDRAERAERTGPTSASQLSPQVLPAMHKQPRSLGFASQVSGAKKRLKFYVVIVCDCVVGYSSPEDFSPVVSL